MSLKIQAQKWNSSKFKDKVEFIQIQCQSEIDRLNDKNEIHKIEAWKWNSSKFKGDTGVRQF